MIQFIQDFFLSPFLIMVILIGVFVVLTWWALRRHKEYIGYGLGWLIGVFLMVVYGALIGDPQPPVGPPDGPTTLNILQVIFPSLIGLGFGAWALWMIRQSYNRSVQKSIVIALLTAVSISVIFLMIVSSGFPATQRMIGLFALAFAIGAVTMYALSRQSGSSVPVDNLPSSDNLRSEIPNASLDDRNTGNRIRGRIDRRR